MKADIRYVDGSTGAEPGWYVSFDQDLDSPDSDWVGPFETQQATQDYASSIFEAAAVAAVKSMFN